MKRYITLIFCLIGLSSIAADYNTQADIDEVVNSWATKWNITHDVTARFERLTGANPNDSKTFNRKFKKYVKDFFAKKSTKNAKKVNFTREELDAYKATGISYNDVTFDYAQQRILTLNDDVVFDNKTVTLSYENVVEVIESKYYRGNKVALMLKNDIEYKLSFGDQSLNFMVKDDEYHDIQHVIESVKNLTINDEYVNN